MQWDLAELPAAPGRSERIAVYIEIVFHHIWEKQELPSKSGRLEPSHHLAGDEDVVDVLVLGLAI